MAETTAPTLHTCAISGEQSAGLHYVLKTTEGEQLVCPEALFHNGADRRMVTLLVELQQRVSDLEERLNGDAKPQAGKGAAAEGNEGQAQAKPPAKKTAAKKTAASKGGA